MLSKLVETAKWRDACSHDPAQETPTQVIDRIAREVSVSADGQIFLLGDVVTSRLPDFSDAISAGAIADPRTRRVQSLLYSRYHMGDRAAALQTTPDQGDEMESKLGEFGFWSKGWAVENVHEDGALLVEQRGYRRSVRPGQYVLRAAQRDTRVGDEVDLWILTQSGLVQDGFHYHFGIDQENEDHLFDRVRFYFNVVPQARTQVSFGIAAELRTRKIDFTLKHLLNKSVARCDGVVLYISVNQVPWLVPVFQQLLPQFDDLLEDPMPAMTCRLCRGVSVAYDPAGGASYGLHVFAPIAKAIVRCGETGRCGARELAREIRREVKDLGLHPARPYAGPKSHDSVFQCLT